MSRQEAGNLNKTLENLKSDRVVDRQQGYSALRATFDRESVILHFDGAGDGKAWLAVFKALFQAFAKELKSCIAKTGAFPTDTTGRESTSVRRLGEVASLVRWLTERSLTRLNYRVLKSLLLHLTHALVHRGELIAPVALPYAKAIKSILTYKPHLHNLRDPVWHELLALAFNVVVGPAPKRTLFEHVGSDDSDGMDVDSDEEGGTGDGGTHSSAESAAGPSTPRTKRPREASPPRRTAPRRGTVPQSSQPVSLEQIEFMSIIAILLRSPTAPILDEPIAKDVQTREAQLKRKEEDPHMFPRLLLNYFSHFLRIYTGDTSLHHDYLIALSAALSHFTLNCRQVVTVFANDSWPSLVKMWGTKNQRMKEDLVVVFRFLFPLLTAEPLEGEANVDPTAALASLWSALDGEAQSRWGIHGLSLECLQLRLLHEQDHEGNKRAFFADTFQYGWHFDGDQALSWATLELQADCAEKVEPLIHRKRFLC